MIRLLSADIRRMHAYFGGGTKTTLRLPLTRSFWALVLVRLRTARVPVVGLVLRALGAVLLANVFKIELAGRCQIGPGLLLPHPNDVIIGAYRIGSNAMLMNCTTLGAQWADPGFDPALRPTLGDGVTIGAGARVLGGIKLGDGVTVGANAVVTRDAASGQTLVGIPARPLSDAKTLGS